MKTLVAFFGLLALANGQCCMGGTLCPAGCCPEADWFCCENNWQCAATPADCCPGSYEECFPAENQHQLLKMNGERISDVSTEAHQILEMGEEKCCPGGTTLNQLLRQRQSLDFQDALNYSGMMLLLLLLSLSPLSSPWLLPIILSPLQLIRRPASLLRLLRPLRVAAGPVSIVSSIAIAGGQLKEDLTIFQNSAAIPRIYLSASILHATSVLIFAIIAGIIFRPDNMSVLQLLVQGAKVKKEGEPTELERVEPKGQLPLLSMCTLFVKDLKGLFPDSLLTSYNRRVEIHALANAVVLLLCVVRATATWLICVLFLQNL